MEPPARAPAQYAAAVELRRAMSEACRRWTAVATGSSARAEPAMVATARALGFLEAVTLLDPALAENAMPVARHMLDALSRAARRMREAQARLR